jgi:molybdopterin adenylyltransferase
MTVRAALLTISTSRWQRGGQDESGRQLIEFARAVGAEISGRETLPDERGVIEERLRYWADTKDCHLILTSGGTGFSPTDVTPEATRAVLDREAPGLGEAMRAASRAHTSHWMLSRAVAGTRGSTLILNFPGSPKSIKESGAEISSALGHALELLAGGTPPHG